MILRLISVHVIATFALFIIHFTMSILFVIIFPYYLYGKITKNGITLKKIFDLFDVLLCKIAVNKHD